MPTQRPTPRTVRPDRWGRRGEQELRRDPDASTPRPCSVQRVPLADPETVIELSEPEYLGFGRLDILARYGPEILRLFQSGELVVRVIPRTPTVPESRP